MELRAPEGQVWVCKHCGKTETSLAGERGGFDESCALNAELYPLDQLVMCGTVAVGIKPKKSSEDSDA